MASNHESGDEKEGNFVNPNVNMKLNMSAFPPLSIMATSNKNSSKSKSQKEKEDEKATCDKYVRSGLNRNVTVKFLMERLIGMGCTPPKGFINCIDCGTKYASGGFGVVEEETTVTNISDISKGAADGSTVKTRHECSDTFIFDTLPSKIQQQNNNATDSNKKTKLRLLPEIFLCQQHIVSEDHAHQSLVHELIHAIDLCRTKMDPINNCVHMACTEIRAENLSGECNMMRELINRRVTNFKGHGAECVKRRAILSVEANPTCKGRSKEFVDAAFDRCFKDTFPFDRHPNLR